MGEVCFSTTSEPAAYYTMTYYALYPLVSSRKGWGLPHRAYLHRRRVNMSVDDVTPSTHLDLWVNVMCDLMAMDRFNGGTKHCSFGSPNIRFLRPGWSRGSKSSTAGHAGVYARKIEISISGEAGRQRYRDGKTKRRKATERQGGRERERESDGKGGRYV